MGQKGGGGRVGLGSGTNKGPRPLGGKHGAGSRIHGGGTHAAVHRAAGGNATGKTVSLANFRRQAGVSQAEAVAEMDRLVESGQAEYAYVSNKVASVLRGHGQTVVERNGKPVRGFKVTGQLA